MLNTYTVRVYDKEYSTESYQDYYIKASTPNEAIRLALKKVKWKDGSKLRVINKRSDG